MLEVAIEDCGVLVSGVGVSCEELGFFFGGMTEDFDSFPVVFTQRGVGRAP